MLRIVFCLLTLLQSLQLITATHQLKKSEISLQSESWVILEKPMQGSDEQKVEDTIATDRLAYQSPVEPTYRVKPAADRVGWVLSNGSYRSFFLTQSTILADTLQKYIQNHALSKSSRLGIYIETFIYNTKQQPVKPIVYFVYFDVIKKETKRVHFISSQYHYEGKIVIKSFNPNKRSLYQIEIDHHYYFFKDTPLFGSLTSMSQQQITTLTQKMLSMHSSTKSSWFTSSSVPQKIKFEISAAKNNCQDGFVGITYFLGKLFDEKKLVKPLPQLFLQKDLCLNNKNLVKKIKPGLQMQESYCDSYFIDWNNKNWTDTIKVTLLDDTLGSSSTGEKKKFSSKKLLKNVGYPVKKQSIMDCVMM